MQALLKHYRPGWALSYQDGRRVDWEMMHELHQQGGVMQTSKRGGPRWIPQSRTAAEC